MNVPYRLVFLDVDSTLVSIEGIDVLGSDDPRIAKLTEAAMNGEIPLEDVYGRRLEIIRPSSPTIERLGLTYRQSILDGAKELITDLLRAGCDVHLVTAGIAQAVMPLANELGIPERNVHAVRLHFGEDGSYLDFDRHSKLAKTRGKEVTILNIRARRHGKAVMIGDGMSDLEAKPAVDLFIAFTQVARRKAVVEAADAVAADFHDLRNHLLRETS